MPTNKREMERERERERKEKQCGDSAADRMHQLQ